MRATDSNGQDYRHVGKVLKTIARTAGAGRSIEVVSWF
jgi:hypothetical protein